MKKPGRPGFFFFCLPDVARHPAEFRLIGMVQVFFKQISR